MLLFRGMTHLNIGSGNMPWHGNKPKDKDQLLFSKLYVSEQIIEVLCLSHTKVVSLESFVTLQSVMYMELFICPY